MSWADVKYALNSTVGTTEFQALDKMIDTVIGMFYGEILITESKTFTVPDKVKKLYISGCGAGGNGASGSTKIAGNAGQYVIQEEVSVNPGDVFTITVGTGNTVISSTGGYNKTLVANSVQTEHHINLIGWETGYNGEKGTGFVGSGEDGGSGGYGGAFGFGGGGGGNGCSEYYDAGSGGKGGSASGGNTERIASLTAGASGGNGVSSSNASSRKGGDGGDAGGYGAGGGAGGYGSRTGAGGAGSQGMVFIQWGTLQ